MNCTSRGVAFCIITSSLAAQAAWSRLYPATSPGPRTESQMAFDSARGRSLLFSGWQGASAPSDLWSWDGTTWTQAWVLSAGGPAGRQGAVLVFDSARGRLVLFGGNSQGVLRNDTWEWDGSWFGLAPQHAPTARDGAAAAFDPRRGVTVMFGGRDSQSVRDDLWEWDGVDWVQRPAPNGPTARASAAMAFDPNTQTVLLFGGAAPGITFDETWTWDGSTWQQRFPRTLPYARVTHTMVSDTARRRVVLVGDHNLADPFAWEWDGVTWSIALCASPSPRRSPVAAYDSARREVVLFGGSPQGFNASDTWVYRTASPATSVAFGSGCAGSAGVPVLAHVPYWLPWLGDTFRTRVGSLGANAGAVYFVTGVTATPPLDLTGLGMPGCSSLVTIDSLALAPVGHGEAVSSLTIPNLPVLNGVHLYQQAAVLEPGANAAGVILSNAIDFGLGKR